MWWGYGNETTDEQPHNSHPSMTNKICQTLRGSQSKEELMWDSSTDLINIDVEYWPSSKKFTSAL